MVILNQERSSKKPLISKDKYNVFRNNVEKMLKQFYSRSKDNKYYTQYNQDRMRDFNRVACIPRPKYIQALFFIELYKQNFIRELVNRFIESGIQISNVIIKEIVTEPKKFKEIDTIDVHRILDNHERLDNIGISFLKKGSEIARSVSIPILVPNKKKNQFKVAELDDIKEALNPVLIFLKEKEKEKNDKKDSFFRLSL